MVQRKVVEGRKGGGGGFMGVGLDLVSGKGRCAADGSVGEWGTRGLGLMIGRRRVGMEDGF